MILVIRTPKKGPLIFGYLQIRKPKSLIKVLEVPGASKHQHMAVSGSWGLLLVGALMMRALLFGVYVRVPDFWETPTSEPKNLHECEHVLG